MPSDELIQVLVAARRREAEGIDSFELVAAGGAPLPAFAAGAHIDLHLSDGWVRPYSLCNPQDAGRIYRVAVQHEQAGRGGSAAVHAQLLPGATLRISRPRNFFALQDHAAPVLLLAGGIGITPLLGMAETLHAAGRPFRLVYCTASQGRAAFVDALRAAPWSARAVIHHDDRDGRLDIAGLLASQPADARAYVCGPPGFIAAATGPGWNPERLRVERFGVAPPPPASLSSGAIEVQAGRNGPVITVPAGTPITVALERAGVRIPVSCEQGVCGTCATRVLEGEVEHRDFHLSAQEKAHGLMLPCCSWARSSRLVLDV